MWRCVKLIKSARTRGLKMSHKKTPWITSSSCLLQIVHFLPITVEKITSDHVYVIMKLTLSAVCWDSLIAPDLSYKLDEQHTTINLCKIKSMEGVLWHVQITSPLRNNTPVVVKMNALQAKQILVSSLSCLFTHYYPFVIFNLYSVFKL